MQYIHVRNLEKYHPGYKDRKLTWAKIFTRMAQGDPDCDLIENEIDWARLIKFILLELEAQAPLPLSPQYLSKKGFVLSGKNGRPIELTLRMLQKFIVVCGEPLQNRNVDKEGEKEGDLDKEGEKEEESVHVAKLFEYFKTLTKKTNSYKLTDERKKLIIKGLKNYTESDLMTAMDNFASDDWDGRAKFNDLIYCLGTINKVNKIDYWLNYNKTNHLHLTKQQKSVLSQLAEMRERSGNEPENVSEGDDVIDIGVSCP